MVLRKPSQSLLDINYLELPRIRHPMIIRMINLYAWFISVSLGCNGNRPSVRASSTRTRPLLAAGIPTFLLQRRFAFGFQGVAWPFGSTGCGAELAEGLGPPPWAP